MESKAKTFLTWIWTEIHRGNMLVIAGCIAAYIWIVLPIYKELKYEFSMKDEADTYIMQDLQALREEIEGLKKSTKIELDTRRAGHVGTTRH